MLYNILMAFAIHHCELTTAIHVSPQSWNQHPPIPLSTHIYNIHMEYEYIFWIIFTIHFKAHSHHNDLHTFWHKSLDVTAPITFVLLFLIPRIFHHVYVQDFSLFLMVCAQNAFIERSPMTHILFLCCLLSLCFHSFITPYILSSFVCSLSTFSY